MINYKSILGILSRVSEFLYDECQLVLIVSFIKMSSCDRCDQVNEGSDGKVDDGWEEKKGQANPDLPKRFCRYIC